MRARSTWTILWKNISRNSRARWWWRRRTTHTSRLAGSSPIEKPTADALPLALRVSSYPLQPLLFEPDSQYLYSNEGMNSVGRIIEVVSGQSYADFVAQRILQPLGMKDTTFWPTDEQAGRLAKSYRGNKDKSDLEETPIGAFRYPLSD